MNENFGILSGRFKCYLRLIVGSFSPQERVHEVIRYPKILEVEA